MLDLSEYLKLLLAVKEETQRVLDMIKSAEEISKYLNSEPLDLARKVAAAGVERIENLMETTLEQDCGICEEVGPST